MLQSEMDDKISALRIEKLMLIKSKERVTDSDKILAIEKRIVQVNNEMKELRRKFKNEIKK